MGKKKDLSPRKKALIEFHLNDILLSQRDIARKLNVSQKSVSRIHQSVREGSTPTVKRVGRCGRKKKISPRTERQLVHSVVCNRRVTSSELANNLKDTAGVVVSSSTVRRTLIDNGMKAYRPRKKAKITPSMAKKRLAWQKK